MKIRILLLAIVLIIGLSPMASAGFVGSEITLDDFYGASRDWRHDNGDPYRYELWLVLADAGYTDLAADVDLDINGGDDPSLSYRAYEDSFWQYPGYSSWLIEEVAGYAGNNRFGWYERNSLVRGELFSGSDTNGATATFTNSNEIGFWLNPDGKRRRYYYTDTSSNYRGKLQAVTFYLGNYPGFGNEYLICFEDLYYCCGDKDYQDMIVRLHPVPEPTSMLLFGLGALGFGAFRRKRKI